MLRFAAAAAGVIAFVLAANPVAATEAAVTDSRATQQPVTGPDSGLPVPRFVSLDADEANGRRRPDPRAPIDWVYTAPGLPLRVTAESGPWRRVEDPEGGQVWMHTENLSNAATVYVRGNHRGEAMLRAAPRPDARTLAILEVGVIARVADCRDGWARLSVDDKAGWVRADALWGAVSCEG